MSKTTDFIINMKWLMILINNKMKKWMIYSNNKLMMLFLKFNNYNNCLNVKVVSMNIIISFVHLTNSMFSVAIIFYQKDS